MKKVIFTLVGKPNANGEKTIAIRVDNEQKSTGLTWPPCQWHRGNPTGVNATGLNARQLTHHLNILKAQAISGIEVPAEVLTAPKAITLPSLIERYAAGRDLAFATTTTLKGIAKRFGSRELTPSNIEEYFSQRRAKLNASSFNTERAHLLSVLNYAEKIRILPKGFTPEITSQKTIENNAVFLNADEIRAMDSVPLPTELEEERHRFIFQCLTGLRASDIATLTTANVHGDTLEIVTRKTSVPVSIPLSDSAKAHLSAIIGKPTPATSKRDMMIKQIAKLAGLNTPVVKIIRQGAEINRYASPKWQAIGTHTARRSFVCNLIAKGVSADIIMSMTGHKSYTSLQKYISVANPSKRKAIDQLDY